MAIKLIKIHLVEKGSSMPSTSKYAKHPTGTGKGRISIGKSELISIFDKYRVPSSGTPERFTADKGKWKLVKDEGLNLSKIFTNSEFGEMRISRGGWGMYAVTLISDDERHPMVFRDRNRVIDFLKNSFGITYKGY